MKPRPYRRDTATILDHLEQELTKDLENHTRVTDSVIWHYTDVGGLTGIIQSGKLRATNAMYLNDAMEVHHALEVISDEVARRGRSSNPAIREFLDHIEAVGRIATMVQQPYVTCFSGESARDLLSQWRACGGDGAGYALGFIPAELAKVTETSVKLRRIIYEETTQTQLVNSAIHQRTVQSRHPTRGREAYSDIAFGVVDEFSISYSVLKEGTDKETGTRELLEGVWQEWSPVLRGMNSETQLLPASHAAQQTARKGHFPRKVTSRKHEVPGSSPGGSSNFVGP